MSLPTTAPNAQTGTALPVVESRDMSRTATLSSDQSDQSPSRTLTDLSAPQKAESTAASALGPLDKETEKKSEEAAKIASEALSSLPPLKKTTAFIAFCLAMFM